MVIIMFLVSVLNVMGVSVGIISWNCVCFFVFFFFFQAEDGIRDIGVTGVQTCALPIFLPG